MVEKLNWDAAYLLIGILLTNANGATEVSCVFMERCILPCSFQTGNEITIKWFKTAGDKLVHLFNYNKDQLKLQDQCFRNRTLLFMDMISSGNASLQLTGVEIQDEGIYNCITHTTRENQESFVNLNINAPVNNVNIDEIEDRITCWSEGIYPEPQLTWSTSPTPNITFLSTTTVQQTKQLLYNISSSLMFSDDLCNLLFICTVSTGRTRKTATLRKISLISDPSTDVTIPCTPSNTSLTNFTLLWRFNHNHTIVKQTGTNLTYSVSGEWRQKVVKVFKSGSLMIKDLSAKQEGMYTCKLSNAEVTHTSHIHLRLIKGGHSSTVVIITTVCVSVLIGLLIAALIYIICRIYRKQRGDGVI